MMPPEKTYETLTYRLLFLPLTEPVKILPVDHTIRRHSHQYEKQNTNEMRLSTTRD